MTEFHVDQAVLAAAEAAELAPWVGSEEEGDGPGSEELDFND